MAAYAKTTKNPCLKRKLQSSKLKKVKTSIKSNTISKRSLLPKDFKTPAEIYHILAGRQAANPLFLQRNLSYMKAHSFRAKTKRSNFKLSTLLDICIQRLQTNAPEACITLDFIGCFIHSLPIPNQCVKALESYLCLNATLFKCESVRGCQTRVQEVMKFNTNIALGLLEKSETFGTICIPLNVFAAIDQENISYKLLFSLETALRTNVHNSLGLNLRKTLKIFKGELNIFDKTCSGFLAEGIYDIIMRETSIKEKNMLNGFVENKKQNGFKATYPCLKFHLKWHQTKAEKLNTKHSIINCKNYFYNMSKKDFINNIKTNLKSETTNNIIKIIYKFRYENNKVCRSKHNLHFSKLTCIWCNLQCFNFKALLKHLQLCHERFDYKYRVDTNETVIYISFNNSKNVAVEHLKTSKTTTKTKNWLFYRKRSFKKLQIKAENKNNLNLNFNKKQRQYFHASTSLPIQPNEQLTDTENEHFPEFLQLKMFKSIDQQNFNLKNDDKSFIKLWNLHMMKQQHYVGRCHMSYACEKFVENFGLKIVSQRLYNAFVLHLGKLFDENLLAAENVWSLIFKIKEIMSKQQGNDYTTISNENFNNQILLEAGSNMSIKEEPASVVTDKKFESKNRAQKIRKVNNLKSKIKQENLQKNSTNARKFKRESKDLKPIRRSARLLRLKFNMPDSMSQ